MPAGAAVKVGEWLKWLMRRAAFGVLKSKWDASVGELIEELQGRKEYGSFWVIPYLTALAVAPDEQLRFLGKVQSQNFLCPAQDRDEIERVATEAIVSILGRTPVPDLVELDALFRADFYTSAVNHVVVAALPRKSPAREALLSICTLSRNGQLREQAVHELAKLNSDRALAFFLLRLNDWVPQVRAAARPYALDRIRSGSIDELIACYPLVDRLRTCKRADHQLVRDACFERLGEPAAIPKLMQNLTHANPLIRRMAFARLLQSEGAELAVLVEHGLASADVYVRSQMIREAIPRLPESEALATLEKLAQEPEPRVRVAALRGILELSAARGLQLLRASLLDRSASVRRLAHYSLRAAGDEPDFVGLYRAALTEPVVRRRAAAVTGLSETGGPSNVDALLPMLADPSGRVVRATIRALAHLDFEGTRPALFACLGDSRLRVRQQAAHVFQKQLDASDYAGLHELVTRDEPEPLALQTLKLVVRMDFWDRARLLLSFPAQSNSTLAERIEAALEAWCHRYPRGPYAPRPATEPELDEIAQRVASASAWLNQALRKQVLDVVESARNGALDSSLG